MAVDLSDLDRRFDRVRGEAHAETAEVVATLRAESTLQQNAIVAVFDAKMSSIKAWGIAAFVGGQTLAGLVGALILKTGSTPAPVRAAAHAVAGLFV
jgi:hypothetical protein